jgi:hypothetical protein
MNIYVQFADSTDKVVVSYFGSPQDPVAWPNQGQIDTSDARWKTYYEALSSQFTEGLPTPD